MRQTVTGAKLTLLGQLSGVWVIGDFRHTGRPDGRAIYVSMYWGPRKQRLARIQLPARVQARLEALDYPSLNEEMGVEAALSYSIFVGMRIGLPVRLTGDMSVWKPAWGRLENVDRELPADTGIPVVLN
jgi:hypothetical protein